MSRLRTVSRCVMGALYIAAGANHFVNADFYIRMMPGYLPWHAELVAVSGVAEALLGMLVMVPATSRFAAWGLITLLLAVFPANINMALHPDRFAEFSPVGLWIRLPVQFLLIWWAYSHTKSTASPGASGNLGPSPS